MRGSPLLLAAALLAAPLARAEDRQSSGDILPAGPLSGIISGMKGMNPTGAPRDLGLMPGGEEAARRSGIALWVYSTNKPGHGRDASMDTFTRGEFARAADPAKVLLQADSVDELRRILDHYREKKVPLRSLTVSAHGAPHMTAVFGLMDLGKLEGVDAGFARGAELRFISCSVAEGYLGAFFVTRIAETFLRSGGGAVRASRGTHFRWDLATDTGGDARLLSGELGTPAGYATYEVSPGGAGRFTEGFVPKTEAAFIKRRLAHLEKKLTAHGVTANEPWKLWDQARTALASDAPTDQQVAQAGTLLQGAEYHFAELAKKPRR